MELGPGHPVETVALHFRPMIGKIPTAPSHPLPSLAIVQGGNGIWGPAINNILAPRALGEMKKASPQPNLVEGEKSRLTSGMTGSWTAVHGRCRPKTGFLSFRRKIIAIDYVQGDDTRQRAEFADRPPIGSEPPKRVATYRALMYGRPAMAAALCKDRLRIIRRL